MSGSISGQRASFFERPAGVVLQELRHGRARLPDPAQADLDDRQPQGPWLAHLMPFAQRVLIPPAEVVGPGQIADPPRRTVGVAAKRVLRPMRSPRSVLPASASQGRKSCPRPGIIGNHLDRGLGLRDRAIEVLVVPLVENRHQPVAEPGLLPGLVLGGLGLLAELPRGFDVVCRWLGPTFEDGLHVREPELDPQQRRVRKARQPLAPDLLRACVVLRSEMEEELMAAQVVVVLLEARG